MDEAEDTEAVLAAYRERKRKALEAQQAASAEADGHGPPQATPALAAPQPASSGAHCQFEHPVAPAAPAAAPVLAAPAPPPATALPSPATPDPSSALQTAARPHALATAPGATLSPLGPALRLSDALLKDRAVSVKGSPALRSAGVAAILLGLALLVLDRRAVAFGGDVPLYRLAGLAVLAAGGLLVVVGLNFPRNRRLAVRLAASQRDEWKRVQAESRRLVLTWRIGVALAVAGLAGLAAAYTLLSMALLGLSAAAVAAGVVMLLAAAVRRGVARRLYVQTMVLSGLEASGLGGTAPDERVTPVILALDDLLGALPEAEVQRFLATPQAKAYLELVDEAARSKRAP